jgi:hypothetical protein
VIVKFHLTARRHEDKMAIFTVTGVRISYLTIFLLARYCRCFLASFVFPHYLRIRSLTFINEYTLLNVISAVLNRNCLQKYVSQSRENTEGITRRQNTVSVISCFLHTSSRYCSLCRYWHWPYFPQFHIPCRFLIPNAVAVILLLPSDVGHEHRLFCKAINHFQSSF